MNEEETVRGIIQRIKQVDKMTDMENLLASGFLDSFDIIHLVDELEKVFHVKIKGKYIIEDNFKSVANLTKLITKLKHE